MKYFRIVCGAFSVVWWMFVGMAFSTEYRPVSVYTSAETWPGHEIEKFTMVFFPQPPVFSMTVEQEKTQKLFPSTVLIR